MRWCQLYAAGGGDPSLRRAFFAKRYGSRPSVRAASSVCYHGDAARVWASLHRLESVGNKVETVVKQREDALDRLFAHLDQCVAAACCVSPLRA